MNKVLPFSSYSDRLFFEQEKKNIFKKHWLLACHESELSGPGDYITLNVAGEPVVVIKGEDGTIRAFVNMCVHRGYPLFHKKHGRAPEQIRCGYHGWSYSRQGDVILPTTKDKKCLSLIPLATNSLHGLIFFCIGQPQKDILTVFKEGGVDLDLLKLNIFCKADREQTFCADIPINWKLFMENTLEGYHLHMVHRGLDELIGHQHKVDCQGLMSVTTTPLQDKAPQTWSEAQYHALMKKRKYTQDSTWYYYFLFPHLLITVFPEQVTYLQVYPKDENLTQIRVGYLMKEQVLKKDRLAAYLNSRIMRRVYKEDLKILSHFKSMSSELFTRFHFTPGDDTAVQHFHHCVYSALDLDRQVDR